MKIATTLAFEGDPIDYAERARDLERAGVDLIWAGEIHGYDLVSALGYLAGQTTTLEHRRRLRQPGPTSGS
jgi:alkanesulfonate monooxygenase SsuD/methylene tetrahydromethanopterin reductase-like flavin-dependent oxidoreductase (luciferase family)